MDKSIFLLSFKLYFLIWIGNMEFWVKRMNNLELQDEKYLEALKAKGFCWIRRYYPRFDMVVRNPTLGYPVEIFTIYHVGCVKIDSRKGKKIINKLCYF